MQRSGCWRDRADSSACNRPRNNRRKIRRKSRLSDASIASRWERCGGVYLCSTLGLTVDKKLSVHELQPLSHTGETKSSPQNCHSGVKAKSRIPTTRQSGSPKYWEELVRDRDFSGFCRRQLGTLRRDIVILAKEVHRIVFGFQFCQFFVLLRAISRLNPAPAFISAQMIGVDSR
jgi:hypothetical protein